MAANEHDICSLRRRAVQGQYLAGKVERAGGQDAGCWRQIELAGKEKRALHVVARG